MNARSTRHCLRALPAVALVASLFVMTTGVADARTSHKKAAAKDSIVARALLPEVAVFGKPGAAKPNLTLPNPTTNGGPRVFLVEKQRADGWIKVLLPIRPNGSTGWVRPADVKLATNPYRIVVSYKKHKIFVYKGKKRVLRDRVGLGRSITPTPGGKYYVNEFYNVTDKSGPYGPFAYALSGFSEKLQTFKGTDAIIGIHGTNDPSGLGKDVSHGCIRMSNEGVTKLSTIIPLGTPVKITKK